MALRQQLVEDTFGFHRSQWRAPFLAPHSHEDYTLVRPLVRPPPRLARAWRLARHALSRRASRSPMVAALGARRWRRGGGVM